MIVIYLLHFDGQVGNARHYLGSTHVLNYDERMVRHSRGQGARLTRRAFTRGINFEIARLWESETRELERVLKRRGHFSTICPLCSPGLHLAKIAKPPGCCTRGLANMEPVSLSWPK